MNKNFKWLTIILAGLLMGTVAATQITPYLYPSNGNVPIKVLGVSITWAVDGTPVTQLDWGTVENSTEYVMDPIKITNTKDLPTTLTLSTTSLSPSIIALILTWNYTDTVLLPTQSVIVELTQNVTATGFFTYTTIVTATEA